MANNWRELCAIAILKMDNAFDEQFAKNLLPLLVQHKAGYEAFEVLFDEVQERCPFEQHELDDLAIEAAIQRQDLILAKLLPLVSVDGLETVHAWVKRNAGDLYKTREVMRELTDQFKAYFVMNGENSL